MLLKGSIPIVNRQKSHRKEPDGIFIMGSGAIGYEIAAIFIRLHGPWTS